MKKLHLSEDIEEVVVHEIPEKEEDSLQTSTLLSSLIKTEWDAVDLFNAVLVTLEDRNSLNEETNLILNDIITDHYKNIGQLEKCLQLLDATALQIEQGKEEVSGIVED